MLLGVGVLLQTNLACGDEILKNTKQEKVLGVTLDKFNFVTHLLNIIKNVNKKFNALTRVQKYMTTDKKKNFSSFIKLQFYYPSLLNHNLAYYSLIWMFCIKRTLRRISNIHERCLRHTQQNCNSEFDS